MKCQEANYVVRCTRLIFCSRGTLVSNARQRCGTRCGVAIFVQFLLCSLSLGRLDALRRPNQVFDKELEVWKGFDPRKPRLSLRLARATSQRSLKATFTVSNSARLARLTRLRFLAPGSRPNTEHYIYVGAASSVFHHHCSRDSGVAAALQAAKERNSQCCSCKERS